MCSNLPAGGARIVLVDDHRLMREFLAGACKKFGYVIAAETGTGAEAIRALASQAPWLLILDLMLPDIDGFDVVDEARRTGLRTRVLAVSSRCDTNTVARVERARFDGFIDKNTAMLADLGRALAALTDGRRYFSASFREVQRQRRADPHAAEKLLTTHQLTILAMIGDLRGDDEIARRMHISMYTAEKHRFRILRRLGLACRAELIRYARNHGFKGFLTEARDRSEGDASAEGGDRRAHKGGLGCSPG